MERKMYLVTDLDEVNAIRDEQKVIANKTRDESVWLSQLDIKDLPIDIETFCHLSDFKKDFLESRFAARDLKISGYSKNEIIGLNDDINFSLIATVLNDNYLGWYMNFLDLPVYILIPYEMIAGRISSYDRDHIDRLYQRLAFAGYYK